MAATDQHYRSQKTLDVVFGVSCALMLVSTLWMLVQDFNREFKAVQRQFRDVEATLAERDMVDKMPDTAKVDQAIHAVRLAKLEVALAKGKAAEQDLSALEERYDELSKFRLDQLDQDNRARLERRLAAIESNPALATADAAFLARERNIKGQREQADETYRNYKASFDAQSSYYNIAIDAGKEKEAESIQKTLNDLQGKLDEWKGKLDDLDYQAMKLREPITPAEKKLADREDDLKKISSTFDRYAKLAAQKSWGVGDTIRALPILDGFASPVKINQIHLPELTIDYGGFKDVPRYDRCTTCHLGIDRGIFDRDQLIRLGDEDESKRLTTKLQAAKDQLDKRVAAGEKLGYSTSDLPGERQGSLGMVAILMLLSALVAAGSLGALERSWRIALNTLFAGLALTAATAGAMAVMAPVVPKVRAIKLTKGEVTQYCAHPRLELFVDGNSAHPAEKFGCTACHEGQGSATDFNLANHTPNDATEQHHWKKKYGWASSHFWDFPMRPNRFTESSCLKCHPQVTDLITKGSKEEAPKLLKGYNIIKDMGCFGCHEIQGLKGGRQVGPDLRLEPGPAVELLSAADQERARSDPANLPGTLRKVGPSLRRLSEKVNEEWTRKWVFSPRGFREDTKMPHFYGLSTNSPDVLPADQKEFPKTEIAAISHYLIAESKNSLQGGDFYRDALVKGKNNVGTLQAKLGKDGLSDKELKDLLDVSKRFSDLALLSNPMAANLINAHSLQQRQLQERLGEIQRRATDMRNSGAGDAALKPVLGELAAPAKELAEVTDALMKSATPVKLSDRLIDGDGNPVALPADGKGDATKGRLLFTERGCLACHAHEGTTKAEKKDGKTVVYSVASDANFGPELSRITEKLSPSADKTTARLWLVQWIMNPNVYHPRTKMPITHLTAEQANDIATWLLAHKPTAPSEVKDPGKPTRKELVDLARVYLAKAPGMTKGDLDKIMPAGDKVPGIPQDRADLMPRDADERVLVPAKAGEEVSDASLTWYVGKKSINRLGCYGCHDIPGFETAKPIGTGLNDWGRKDNARIAFEDGAAFVKKSYHVTHTAPMSKEEMEARFKVLEAKKTRTEEEKHEFEHLEKLHRLFELEGKGELDEMDKAEVKKLMEEYTHKKPYEEMFYHLLEHHQREGFLHLKLMEPRSYDYNRLKVWDDRLRMPQFQFARVRRLKGETDAAFQARTDKEEAEAREAVMTFVLGLVGEPTPVKYINNPKPERAAEVAGRQVLDKYNCAGCHQVRPGVYEFKMTPEVQAKLQETYVKNAVDEAQIANWLKDHVYQNHTAWFGPAPTSDKLTAYGYFNQADTEKAGGGKFDVIEITEALRFYGPDRAAHDLRAGMFITLPKGSYEAHAPYGGTFVDLLATSPGKNPKTGNDIPSYLSAKDATNFPPAEPGKARSVLPPPLVREGERVQPDWLYRFLLNPGEIRPQTYMLLRMPKFNMSPEEARALVNYFAAVSKMTNPGAGVTYPYVAVPQRDPEYWKNVQERYLVTAKAKFAEAEKALKENKDKAKEPALQKVVDGLKDRLNPPADAKGAAKDPYSRSAFQLLTDKNLCISCHNIGSVTGKDPPKAPNLALAGERLRPEWSEHWIANPRRMFTYSPLMPQNFPNAPTPVEWQYQDLFAGSPLQQVRAARDLIMDPARLHELAPTYKPPPPEAKTEDKK